jgi:hypothetical protein
MTTMLGAVVGFALSLVVSRYLRERDATAPLRREIAALRHRAELAERRLQTEIRVRRRAELAAHEARTGQRVRYEDIDWQEEP